MRLLPYRRRFSAASRLNSGGQCSVDIGFQVLNRLEANRKPQQAVNDPEFRALCRLQAEVSCGGRMGDQALHIAEIVRNADETQGVLKPEGCLFAAFEIEGDDLPQ